MPYTGAHVLTQLQLLLFSGLAFFVMLPWLKRTLTITLDTDWLWRRAGPAAAGATTRVFDAVRQGVARAAGTFMDWSMSGIGQRSGPQGVLGGTRPIRSMALWVLVVLLAYLLFYFAG